MASVPVTSETIDGDYAAQRAVMVASQLRTVGVDDPAVLRAMARVLRERFLPAGLGDLAYRDIGVPLGGGRAQNPPMATALLLNALRLRPADRVLLIGAAGGYTAAVLAEIVTDVVAVESASELAAHARAALAGIAAVELVEGPLAEGHAAFAPYDAMLIDGAIEQLGTRLVEQLVTGGRCASGVVERGVTRLAAGVAGAGELGLIAFADADLAVLPGFAKPSGFSFGGV